MLRRVRAFWMECPPNLLATILIVLSFAGFSVQALQVRYSADLLPPMQVVFLRQALAMMVFAPVYWRARRDIVRPNRIDLHLLRGTLSAVLSVATFYALLVLPLADVTAIGLSEVLFSTLFAAILLQEHVGWRRWLATFVGFVGVAVMVGPLQGGINAFALLPLLAALCSGISGIALRMTAGQERLETVLFWQGGTMAILLLPIALLDWQPVTLGDLLVILPMAMVMVTSQALFGAAMRTGQVSALAPLHYLRLAIMAGLGFSIYGEIPSTQATVGGLIIMGAATYTIRRNAARETASDRSGS